MALIMRFLVQVAGWLAVLGAGGVGAMAAAAMPLPKDSGLRAVLSMAVWPTLWVAVAAILTWAVLKSIAFAFAPHGDVDEPSGGGRHDLFGR